MRSTLDLTSTFNSPRTVDHRGNIEPPTLSTYLLYLGLVRDVDVERLIQSIPTSKRIGIVPSHCRHVLVLVLVLVVRVALKGYIGLFLLHRISST